MSIPLARTNRSSCWTIEFTSGCSVCSILRNASAGSYIAALYGMLSRSAEGFRGAMAQTRTHVDRDAVTVWYDKKRRGSTLADGEGEGMSEKVNDPVALWQKMLGEMEKGFNSLANEALASPQFSKAM